MYIKEAHPTDLWQMQANVRENVLFSSPRSDSEREGVANACVRKLGIEIPAVADGISDEVERAYTGWPDRMYLIDRDGRVAYKSKPGPFGFKPEGLRAALARVVPQEQGRRE